MRIVATSDIHGNLPGRGGCKDILLPPAELLCICGDIVPLEFQTDDMLSEYWFLNEFMAWVASLEYERVILIPGNHDYYLYNQYRQGKKPFFLNAGIDVGSKSRCVLLIDEFFEYKGVTFYGTPWIPNLNRWAFYKSSAGLSKKFAAIPNCDILLTHCPPSIGGQGVVLQKSSVYLRNFGSMELAKALQKRDIKWVLSGHIHSGAHYIESLVNDNGKELKMRNVSLLDENYKITYEPFVFEV